MPSTIPYDPSLVLGQLVHQAKLDNLTQIATLQAPADSAEDELNSLISLKRSLDMTIQELINLGVDVTELYAEGQDVNKQIAASAKAYAKAKLASEKAIQPLKAKIKMISDDIESPIDYTKSDTKQLPLSADSLKMNVQYFSYDENAQTSATHAATISAFVSDETKDLGADFSAQVSASVASQTNSQHERHSIAGTLVISVVCTHKNAVMYAPLILDVDKAIRAWNRVYPDAMIKTDSLSTVATIAAQANTPQEKSITILSGATYGSCFIGMVHVLNTTDTQSSEALYTVASKMSAQFKIGGWFASESGGFGVDSTFSNDTKNLLSSQNINAHCSLVTMGSIPSIKSNQVQGAVKGFVDDDAAKSMAAVQKIQNATASDFDTVDDAAKNARTGQQMIALTTSKVQAALSGLAEIDKQNNQIIDTTSMMQALDDYIQKCLQGNIGVPINFYLKPITRSQLAQMWVAKYYPGRFLAISGDDSAPAGGGAQAATASTAAPAST
jgi:hypothetical protein